jgi:hypothetical protein
MYLSNPLIYGHPSMSSPVQYLQFYKHITQIIHCYFLPTNSNLSLVKFKLTSVNPDAVHINTGKTSFLLQARFLMPWVTCLIAPITLTCLFSQNLRSTPFDLVRKFLTSSRADNTSLLLLVARLARPPPILRVRN